jgi:hypothetical protein
MILLGIPILTFSLKILQSHGRYATKQLGLGRGTNASAYTQLYIGFFISGVIHQFGDYTLLRNWSGGSVLWFTMQAMAITFEDGVIALAKRCGLSGGLGTRILGYLWVWTWFACSLPLWADPMLQNGMSEGHKFSLILGLWEGRWTR